MGTLRFGRQDTLTCIVDVDLRGPKDEALCLASKATTYWVAGGVYLSDEGYVLKIRDQTAYYELPSGAREGQVSGLPHPLPPYSIPTIEYVMGYSLWWAIGVVILWAVGVKVMRRRRQAALAARLASAPIDRGPPRLDTEGDRFVYETVKAMLAPGESIQHQAYATSWDYNNDQEGDDCFFVALTTSRLIVVETRKGAFGILYENNGVTTFERARIASAAVEHGHVLFVTTDDGIQRGYIVKSTKKLSNQDAFLVNVVRLLGGGAPPEVGSAPASVAGAG